MDLLAQSGYIQLAQAQAEKLSTAKQKQIIELFLNLYSSGFICLRLSIFWVVLT